MLYGAECAAALILLQLKPLKARVQCGVHGQETRILYELKNRPPELRELGDLYLEDLRELGDLRELRSGLNVDTCPCLFLQFFPYILLLVAVLMYTPALFWRFSAAPLLQSDLGFIMEELDRCYNRAVTLAKRMATSGMLNAERYWGSIGSVV